MGQENNFNSATNLSTTCCTSSSTHRIRTSCCDLKYIQDGLRICFADGRASDRGSIPDDDYFKQDGKSVKLCANCESYFLQVLQFHLRRQFCKFLADTIPFGVVGIIVAYCTG